MSKFHPIIGHSERLGELKADLDTGNISHAYLFTGPRHIGKMTVAYWFALQLLCEGFDEVKKEACIHTMEKLMHPDFLVLDTLFIDGVSDDWDAIAKDSNIQQQHRGKAPKAKTDSISIDDIRAVQERLFDTSLGSRRVCIIRSLERMQDAAANAFLKILEEPPKGLIFLLTSQALSSLLPTITSRSRVLRFQRLSTQEMRPIVKNAANDDQQFILELAQGAPGIAKTLLADPDALRAEKTIYAHAQSFWSTNSLLERMKLLKPLHTRGEEANNLLLHLALSLRSIGPKPGQSESLHALMAGYKTNAHRELLAKKFAISISE